MAIYMKSVGQLFLCTCSVILCITIKKIGLTFKSVRNLVHTCEHSTEGRGASLSCGTVCYQFLDN